MLTQERLKELLNYNPLTGIFTRLVTSGGALKGSEVGCLTPKGYLTVQIDGKTYRLNRLAWFYVYGVWPNISDHKNGIRTDNSIDNLRDLSVQANTQNQRKATKTNKSGLLGVTLLPHGRYRAQITVNKKNICLGVYGTPEEAHQVYVEAKRKLHSSCTI